MERQSSAPVKDFVAAQLTIEDLWDMSVGKWKGLRSSHNIAFSQLEQVHSDMTIDKIAHDDEELLQVLDAYNYDRSQCASALRVSWVSTSDWDDYEKETTGSSVVAVLKTEGDRKGKVLRSIGYTEEIPAASDWELREDGSFYMKTFYTMTGAEETIWFATPDLRMRLSNILSKGGKGVTTSTLTTERRQKSPDRLFDLDPPYGTED